MQNAFVELSVAYDDTNVFRQLANNFMLRGRYIITWELKQVSTPMVLNQATKLKIKFVIYNIV